MSPRRNKEIQKANRKLKLLLKDYWTDESIIVRSIVALLEKCPKAARIRDKRGNLPLQMYCGLGEVPKLSVVEALIQAYPESIETTNVYGDTALHTVCCRLSNWSMATICFLVEEHPGALLVKNKCGETPLHQLISRVETINDVGVAYHFRDVVEFMVDACPESVKVLNNEKETLLHRLCKNINGRFAQDQQVHVYKSVFRLFLKSFPEAGQFADNEGRLPMHALCNSLPRQDSGRIQRYRLYYNFGTASTVPYVYQRLDIFYEVIQGLIEAFPLGAYASDNNGVTPLQIAHEKGIHLSVIYELFRIDPLKSMSYLRLGIE